MNKLIISLQIVSISLTGFLLVNKNKEGVFGGGSQLADVLYVDTASHAVGVNVTNPIAQLDIGGAASISTNSEAKGYASASQGLFNTSLIVGGRPASGSNVYQGEFTSTGTTSLNLTGSATNKGTCLQMKNTAGQNVYIRVFGTTLTVTTIKCHP